MFRIALIGLAAIALPLVAIAASTALIRGDAAAWQRIEAAYDKADCGPALRDGPALIERLDAGRYGVSAAASIELVVRCEIDAKNWRAARAHALRGTSITEAADELWRYRLAAELQDNAYPEAVATLEAMRDTRGRALNSVPSQWIGLMRQRLEAAGKEDLTFRMLKALVEAYSSDEPMTSTDYLRYRYAGMLARRGDDAGVRKTILDIDDPSTLATISLDPRFRALLRPDFDLRAAAERDLANHRAALAAHPDLLEPTLVVAGNLRALGRPEEALETVDAVAAAVAEPGSFTDGDDRIAWWWDARSRSLADLGRYGEAVTSLLKAVPMAEGGTPNVSHVINLAALHIRFGRGEAALKVLEAFSDPKRRGSPYGEMEMRYQRGCAHAVTGHPEAAAADLAYVREHEKDHPQALGDLLLCLGDMDGAAAAFSRRLDDPDRRAAALLQLSDFDAPAVPGAARLLTVRLAALKTRADMRAAIERAGGIRRFRVQPGEL